MRKFILTALMLVGLAFTSPALTIHLGDTEGQPADVPSETARLEALLSGNPELPNLVNLTGVKTEVEFGGPTATFNLDGFNGYLMLKWGNKDCFWYINDNLPASTLSPLCFDCPTSSTYTFYSDNPPNWLFSENGQRAGIHPPAGLSHYTLWGESVPDGGSTLALMGLGLLGIAGGRRFAS